VSKVVDNWSGNPCCCDKNENCSPLPDKTDSYTKSEETGFTGTVSVTASLSTSEKASIGVEMVGEVGGSVTEDISAEGSGSLDTMVTETNTATIGPVHSCQVGGAKLEVRDVQLQTRHSLYQDETGYMVFLRLTAMILDNPIKCLFIPAITTRSESEVLEMQKTITKNIVIPYLNFLFTNVRLIDISIIFKFIVKVA